MSGRPDTRGAFTDLQQADLQQADLQQADLRRVDLRRRAGAAA
ncbi:pentapeptide repeat-containing protein [Streptosporangium sp. NPDC023825]